MSKLGRYQQIIEANFGSDYIVSGSEMVYHCPYCAQVGKRSDDYKLYVNSVKGVYNCFRCGTSGAIKLDSDSELVVEESIDLSSMVSQILNPTKSKSESQIYIELPESKLVNYSNSLAYQYMTQRGITPELMEFYDIRAFGDTSLTHNRVVLPNKVVNGKWTDFFTSRALISTMTPKYLNSDLINKSEIVYNLHRIKPHSHIIINEGIINSMIAGTNSVAILGKTCSNSQLHQILSKKPESVTVSLDTDAISWALRLARNLKSAGVPKVRVMYLPDNKDASDLGHDLYMKYYEEAVEYSRYSNLYRNILEVVK